MSDELVKQGQEALKAGDKARARQLLISAIKQNPDNEQAWSWLYNAVEAKEQKIRCLQEVLRINPGNDKARKALERFQLKPTPMPIEPQKPVPVPDQPPPVEIKHAAPRVDKSLNKHHIGWQVALLAGVIVILSLIFVVIAIQIFPLKKDNFPIVTFTSTPSLTNTLETTDTPVYTLTPTPLPIPTATPIPLSDLQLEPLLIQPGDLPAGYQGAQVRDTAPQMFTGIPTAESIIFVQFEKSGDAAGFVVVFLYDDKTNIDRAYQFTVDSLGDSANSVEVGEKAMVVTFSDIVAGVHMELADLTFFRCNAVILIRMTKDINRDSIVAYAKRLDSRLKPVVCR